jgi:hypothetical protein
MESSAVFGKFACNAKVTFAVADRVKLISTWPVEVSEGVAKF